MSRAAESAHAATIDKAEYAFGAIGIYPYRESIMPDEDFQASEVAHGHLDVGSRLRVDGPEMLTLASLRTPNNIVTARKCCSH
jgi:hypothetical protein